MSASARRVRKIVIAGLPGEFDTPEQARIAYLESLLREAEKFCPRSLTGGGELGNRIEEALKGDKA